MGEMPRNVLAGQSLQAPRDVLDVAGGDDARALALLLRLQRRGVVSAAEVAAVKKRILA